MAGCELLDWRCIFVNEIFGSPLIAALFLILGYLIISIKMDWDFLTSALFAVPLILIISLMFLNINSMIILFVVAAGILVAWMANRAFGNS